MSLLSANLDRNYLSLKSDLANNRPWSLVSISCKALEKFRFAILIPHWC